jgi:hypothetical protein
LFRQERFFGQELILKTNEKNNNNKVSPIQLDTFIDIALHLSTNSTYNGSSTYLEIDGPLVKEDTVEFECLAQIGNWKGEQKGSA